MTRYGTVVEDGTVYVEADIGTIEVGSVDEIVEILGGPAWTIEYDDEDLERYPQLDTSDAGLTVDVVDSIHAMTFGPAFIETLKAQPLTVDAGDGTMSPRLGLFVGRLIENLEYGVR